MVLNLFFVAMLLCNTGNTNKMLVRVYTEDYRNLSKIQLKSLDIAGRRYGEYFDIVIPGKDYSEVVVSGLNNEIISTDMEQLKEKFRGQYHSYDEVTQILRNFVSSTM